MDAGGLVEKIIDDDTEEELLNVNVSQRIQHYQQNISDGDCTFGEHITPVVGYSSMDIDIAPIEFDIDFKWPVSYVYVAS